MRPETVVLLCISKEIFFLFSVITCVRNQMAMGKVSSHCFFVLLCAVFSCFHTTSCGAYSLTKQCSTKLAKAFVSVWLSVGGAEEWRNLQRTPGELWQLDEHQPERSHLHIQGEWQLDLSVNVLIFLVSLNVNSSCFCDCPGTFNASPYTVSAVVQNIDTPSLVCWSRCFDRAWFPLAEIRSGLSINFWHAFCL